jgi:hypothetical protein
MTDRAATAHRLHRSGAVSSMPNEYLFVVKRVVCVR